MVQPVKDNRNWMERKLNIPPLGDLTAAVTALNNLTSSVDKKKIKEFENVIDRISVIPTEKFQAAKAVIDSLIGLVNAVDRLVKGLPPDMIKDIKLSELIDGIKKDMGK